MKNTVGEEKIQANKSKLEIRLPDTRGVTLSRWGAGNLKIGLNVITYSKLALATCPGASVWCKGSCYAQRIAGVVAEFVYKVNTEAGANVPDFPSDTDSKLCRPHVSGDFDSVAYIQRWTEIVKSRPDVQFWAYTRSWRMFTFQPALEQLRALPNMQLFASMDESTPEMPPIGWRIAWIEGDPRIASRTSVICPEERKKVANCEKCGYCFRRFNNVRDVVFLKH
jgi:hypothetical protein